MFLVLNKEKIFSFVLAIGMVGILLGMTNTMSDQNETVETSYYLTNGTNQVYQNNEINNEQNNTTNNTTTQMQNQKSIN